MFKAVCALNEMKLNSLTEYENHCPEKGNLKGRQGVHTIHAFGVTVACLSLLLHIWEILGLILGRKTTMTWRGGIYWDNTLNRQQQHLWFKKILVLYYTQYCIIYEHVKEITTKRKG